MKKLTKFLWLFALVLVANSAWASSHGKHSATATATVATGAGSVYVSASEIKDESTITGWNATESKQTFQCYEGNSDGNASNDKDYSAWAYAKADEGSSFVGWYTDQACTTPAASNKMTATVGSTAVNAQLYAKFIEKKSVTVTLSAPAMGSYSVTDGTQTANSGATISSENKLTFTATVPSGYEVFGWYVLNGQNKEFFCYNDNSVSKTFEANATVGVEFVKAGLPRFIIKGTPTIQYHHLADAVAAASSGNVIVLVKDGTCEETCTIPSGVTLLIPYEDTYKVNTTTCYYENADKTIALYRKLTLAAGAKLTVNGELCVNSAGVRAGAGGTMAGRALGAFGQIDTKEGSEISIENGGKLYVWGYITGKGNVIAKNGAKLYEALQFDFRGGSHISAVYKTVLPLNQYYVQNIEAHLTMYAGATETLYTAAYAASTASSASANFIASDGLFVMESGSRLERFYDGTTDRVSYDIYGNTTLNHLAVNVSGYGMDSKDFVLPLTNNMTIRIQEGTTSIKYAAELLADGRIEIAEGATAEIKSNLFVFDTDEWVGKTISMSGDLNAVTYAPGRTYKNATTTSRAGTKMVDATILVNGTLKMTNTGYLYTTTGGANICSTGAGKIILGAGVGDKTSFKENKGTTKATQSIAVTPAQLKNADGSYTETAGAAAGTTYNYINGVWAALYTIKYANYDGTIFATENLAAGTTPAPADPTRDNGDIFAGWETEFQIVSADATYKALFYVLQENHTYIKDGETEAYIMYNSELLPVTLVGVFYKDAEDNYYTYNEGWVKAELSYSINYELNRENENGWAEFEKNAPKTYSYLEATTLVGPKHQQYFFKGWYDNADLTGTAITEIPQYSVGNKTFYAKWDAKVKTIVPVENEEETVVKWTQDETTEAGENWKDDQKAQEDNTVEIQANVQIGAASKDEATGETTVEEVVEIVVSDVKVEEGKTLTISEGSSLTLKGNEDDEVLVSENENANKGTIVVEGTLTIETAAATENIVVASTGTVTVKEEGAAKNITVNEGGTLVFPEEAPAVADEKPAIETITLNATIAGSVMEVVDGEEEKTGEVEAVAPKMENVQNYEFKNTTVTFDLKLDHNKAVSFGWYDFSVPFAVNVMNDVYVPNANNDKNGQNERKLVYGKDYLIAMFSEANRATGASGWVECTTENMVPGQAYSITLDPQRVKSDVIRLKSTINGKMTVSGDFEAQNSGSGWNGVGNGLFANIQLDNNMTYIVYDHRAQAYVVADADNYPNGIPVGTAFFVNVKENGRISFTKDKAASVVKRAALSAEKTEFALSLVKDGKDFISDKIRVAVSDEAETEYMYGRDLLKMGTPTQARVAQMWCAEKGLNLSHVELPLVGNSAMFDLHMYAPSTADYTLNITDEPANATLYLTYNNRVIWNLSMSEYEIELQKGTTTGYGLLLVDNHNAPAVTTDIEAATDANGNELRKVVINGQLYIQKGAQVYDAVGAMVK